MAERTLRRPSAPHAAHLLAGAWVAGMLVLGNVRPELYQAALQEDRFVEWWSVTLFAAAGFFALRLAWRESRFFDGLVGGFCIFVAGEEFSWGQRLLGLTPPDTFLEHNRQQELTLHNFADIFGEPRWVLIMALVGFGVVLPLVAAVGPGRRALARFGATAVQLPLALWLMASVALLWWYPLTLTGEWVEALTGGLFLLAYASPARSAALWATGGAALAVALTLVSGARGASAADLACVRLETEAIAEDLAYGAGATGRLAGSRSVHKRVFTAIQDGYVRAEGLERYRSASCEEVVEEEDRRDFALDPWGSAYWISMERAGDTIRLVVYSFGPNRRRDAPPGTGTGDDIATAIEITP